VDRRIRRGLVMAGVVALVAAAFAAGRHVILTIPSASSADSTALTSYVQSDPPDTAVNVRSCPSQPNLGVTTGECGVLIQLLDGTKVFMRCWDDGNSPVGYTSKRWFYVTAADGAHVGFSGFVFSDFVKDQIKTPLCTDDTTKQFPMGSPGTATLSQGAKASSGYWYAIALRGFPANVDLSVTCADSVTPAGFKTFVAHVDATGTATNNTGCFSGDGPDHWIIYEGGSSNLIRWTAGATAPPAPTQAPTAGSATTAPPAATHETAHLAKGPSVTSGYRYGITIDGFMPGTSVTVRCYDSVSPAGFYTFSLRTDSNGSASTAAYCYSGDGPDHWFTAGSAESNHVTWGGPANPPPPTSKPVSPPQPPPPPSHPTFTVMNTSETAPDGVWFRNSPHTSDTNKVTGLGVYMHERVELVCYAFGDSVGPYNDSLWYKVDNITRPTINGQTDAGFLNAHYIDDGKNANQVDDGVPAC
jgi:hypothetical protein